MIEKMQEDVEFIQKLSDYPTMDDGLDAEEVKKRFDAGAVAIKEFINTSLIPDIEKNAEDTDKKIADIEGNVESNAKSLKALSSDVAAVAQAGKIQVFKIGYNTATAAYYLDGTSYAELKALHDDKKHIALLCDYLDVPECFQCSGMTTLNGVTGLAFHFCFNATSKWAFVGADGSIQVGFMTNASGNTDGSVPDIYQQLLTEYVRANAQLTELLAMRNASGGTEISFSNEHITGSVLTNGVCALIELKIFGLTLDAGNGDGSFVRFDNLIDPVVNPFMSPVLSCFNKTGVYTTDIISVELASHYDVGDGKSELLIRNLTDSEVNIDGWSCVQLYDLANPFNTEVSDIRIGYDGTRYPTAGEAVRKQIKAAMENGGGGGGSVELDTTLTQSGKAADAKAVGDKLGDIETALDSIIAIQESLIGGDDA